MVSVFHHLAYFTQHNALQFYPWTKPKGGEGRIECGRWGWVGQGIVGEVEMGTTVVEQQ